MYVKSISVSVLALHNALLSLHEIRGMELPLYRGDFTFEEAQFSGWLRLRLPCGERMTTSSISSKLFMLNRRNSVRKQNPLKLGQQGRRHFVRHVTCSSSVIGSPGLTCFCTKMMVALTMFCKQIGLKLAIY